MELIFQFQYGAIKRPLAGGYCVPLSSFQFQYGAIKSWADKDKQGVEFYFNSNMVRLKEQKKK